MTFDVMLPPAQGVTAVYAALRLTGTGPVAPVVLHVTVTVAFIGLTPLTEASACTLVLAWCVRERAGVAGSHSTLLQATESKQLRC